MIATGRSKQPQRSPGRAQARSEGRALYPDYLGSKTLDYPHIKECPEESSKSVLTSRNNCDPPRDTPLRIPRPYIQDCCKATLATTYSGGVIRFSPLTCGSWSCSNCRKVNSARLLDRLRRGMESRPGLNRILVTLTINPEIFGGRIVGKKMWDDGRTTNLWSSPAVDQFRWAAECMSIEWKKLNDRLKRKASRAGAEVHSYFRVIELHRSLWPHYHVLIEHPTWTAADIGRQLDGWALGVTDARDISLDDAVGELAPYLTTPETKGGGTKTYQFAGLVLPQGFRLYSCSEGFLAPPREPEEANIVHQGFVLRGHFASHHRGVQDWDGDSRLVLSPPQPSTLPHLPPGSALAIGDNATCYFLAQAGLEPFVLTPEEEASLL